MPDALHGVVLTGPELHYTLRAFEVLLRDRRPSPQLAEHLARLQAAYAESHSAAQNACGCGRFEASGGHPDRLLPGDVLASDEAAAVLGISAAGARDLARRGRLPAVRAGGRWLFQASAVVARAEHRAR